MAINTKPSDIRPYSSTHTDNQSFDPLFQTYVHQPLGYDGVNLQRENADNLAVKITVSGSVTYVGIAAPGTAQSTAKWQCKKIDETSGTIVTWADGDASFDNTATDLTALTYS